MARHAREDEPDDAEVDRLLLAAWKVARWLPWTDGPRTLGPKTTAAEAKEYTWAWAERHAWAAALDTRYPKTKALRYLTKPTAKREAEAVGQRGKSVADAWAQDPGRQNDIILAAQAAGFKVEPAVAADARRANEQAARSDPHRGPVVNTSWVRRMTRFHTLVAREAGAPLMGVTEWAKARGFITTADVDSHIHAGLGGLNGTKTASRFYHQRLESLQHERDQTLAMYKSAVAAGLIREPPPMTLEERAAGHSDLESTRAAVRALANREARRHEGMAMVSQPAARATKRSSGESKVAAAKAAAEKKAAKVAAKAAKVAAVAAAKEAKAVAKRRKREESPEQLQAARELCTARVVERAARKAAGRTERSALSLTRQHSKALQRLRAAECKPDCGKRCAACKRKTCLARPQVRELAQQLQAANAAHAAAVERHVAAARVLVAAGFNVAPLGAPRAPRERTGAPPRSTCGTVCHIQVRQGICGGQAAILLPSAQGSPREVPTRYCMLEADQLITSHDPMSFELDPRYPEATQERRYDRDRAEQGKVLGIAQNPRPELILSTSASPLDGTPIATPEGIVLGGNGRAMGMRLHDARGGTVFTDYLRKVCHEFGFTVAQVKRFRAPIVVRTVDPPASEYARYVRDLNQGLTQAMDVLAEGVSLARQMPAEALEALANGLAGDGELGEFFASRVSLPFIAALERGGIVTAQNRGRLLRTSDGLLTEEGRALAIRQISASILPDADLLELMGAELRQALARTAPFWLAAAAHGGEWDVRPPLKRAVLDLLAARNANLTLRRFFQQVDFFQPPHTHHHPMGLRLLVLLDKLGGKPAVFARVARFFAGEADMYSGRQASFLAPKAPVVALDDAGLQAKIDLPAELRGLA